MIWSLGELLSRAGSGVSDSISPALLSGISQVVSMSGVMGGGTREACHARIPSWRQPCLHYETCLQSFSSKVGLLPGMQVVTHQVALHGITACQKVGSLKILCCSF